ncbi:MAG: hypothetical protein ACH344_11005 [Yersinia sp. (in: enterobacteria)]|jgi:hypothetical protein
MMDIEELNGQSWYLAQYITGGKNREKLFGWLSEQQCSYTTQYATAAVSRISSRR